MTDLFDQLRAYGLQIESDLGIGAHGSTPGSRKDPDEAHRSGSRLQLETADVPDLDLDTAAPGPSSPQPSRSSRWVTVAAVTAAFAITASALFPSDNIEGGTMAKRSGLVLGICLLITGCTGEGGEAVVNSTADPATSTSRAPSSDAAQGSIEPLRGGGQGSASPVAAGTYVIESLGTPVEVTVPAGWSVYDDVALLGPDGGHLSFVSGTVEVYTDACQWVDTQAAVGPSVTDLVAALVAQEPTTTSPPQDVSVGRYAGTQLELSSPSDLDFKSCYGGVYATMVSPERQQIYLDHPGEPHTLWILDLNGERAIISMWAPSSASESTKAQLDSMIASLRFS